MKTGARSRGTLVLAHASPEQLLGQEAIPGPPRQPVQPWEEADDRHSPHTHTNLRSLTISTALSHKVRQVLSSPDLLTFLLQGHLSHKGQLYTSQLPNFITPFFHWCPQAWICGQEAPGLEPHTEKNFPILPRADMFQTTFSPGCHSASTGSNLPRKKMQGTHAHGYSNPHRKRHQPPGLMSKAWDPVTASHAHDSTPGCMRATVFEALDLQNSQSMPRAKQEQVILHRPYL